MPNFGDMDERGMIWMPPDEINKVPYWRYPHKPKPEPIFPFVLFVGGVAAVIMAITITPAGSELAWAGIAAVLFITFAFTVRGRGRARPGA